MVDLKTLHQMLDYDYIRIKFSMGDQIEGSTVCVNYADETQSGENEICIETDDRRIVTLRQSEIMSWEIPLARL